MKRFLLAFCVLLAGTAFAMSVETEPKQVMIESKILDVNNAFADIGIGYTDPTKFEEPSWTATLGYNQGFAINRDWKLGGQIGGQVTMRDDEPNWLVGIGAFQRGLSCHGTPMMWGLQGFWQNTWQKTDLAYIKPTLAWQLTDQCYWGLTGMWGKNSDRVGLCVPWLYTHEGGDMAGAFYGHEWTPQITTELLAGYEFDDVDRVLAGGTLSWQYNSRISFYVSGVGNFTGDYMTSAGIGFDLGSRSKSPKLTYVTQQDDDDYSPLPMDAMTAPRYITLREFR